ERPTQHPCQIQYSKITQHVRSGMLIFHHIIGDACAYDARNNSHRKSTKNRTMCVNLTVSRGQAAGRATATNRKACSAANVLKSGRYITVRANWSHALPSSDSQV